MQDPRTFGPQPGDARWEDLSDRSKEAIIAVYEAAKEQLQAVVDAKNDERPGRDRT